MILGDPVDPQSHWKHDWVEIVQRWCETTGEDKVVVIAQFHGISLKATAHKPRVDTQQIEFDLRQETFQDKTSPALHMEFPDVEERAEFSTVVSAKGTTCFAATIWPMGLEYEQVCVEIWFSTDETLLAQVAPESIG